MAIISKIEIEGTDYNTYLNLRVSTTIDKYNTVSSFVASFDSPYGRYSDTFSVGDTVVIYAKEHTYGDAISWSDDDKIFAGILEKVKFTGQGTKTMLELSGRDNTAKLLDSTVEPIVFTETEVSEIVKEIIARNTTGISVNNVNATSTTLDRIAFNHLPLFEALQQLGELSGYYFYIDADVDLNFKENSAASTGLTFDNTNVTKVNMENTREGMVNEVYVYGDRTLAGFEEDLNFDGGSVYTLLSKPHNTLITIGGVPQKGGVFNLVASPISGTKYLVNFHDKQVIFTSGTDIGDSTPTSGGSGLIMYDRDIPIVKKSQDRDSIDLYGLRRKIINDKSIKDPQTAQDILDNELTKNSPFRGIELAIKGWYDLVNGKTVDVTLDEINLDDTVSLLSVDYDFNKNTEASENIISIKLDNKIGNITDQLKDMKKRIALIEAQDMGESDTITQIETTAGSCWVVGSYWEVRTRLINNSFILGHDINGQLGSPEVSVSGGQVELGDDRSALTVQYSGGFYS